MILDGWFYYHSQTFKTNLLKVEAFPDEFEVPRLFTDLIEHGNLRVQHRISPLTNFESAQMLSQALKGLGFLHEQGIIHGGIKPDNILFSSRLPSLKIKVAECGWRPSAGDRRRDVPYTAPEELENVAITQFVDILSYLLPYSSVCANATISSGR